MAYAQEKLNKQGRDYIAALVNTARLLWVKACEFDHIPPDSKFVVFSDGNKFASFYNRVMGQLFESRQNYADGGYVGLKIVGGKAR